ncbi:hypothetical protein OB920_01265 [Halobacteria archaeon HArc-gm2]|nr:hypothetical protein [Halobacteria archaeon HArc-gm2]
MIDDRAVSTAVSHAITIGITSIMLTGLMIGASQMVDDQRQYVVERGLEDVSSAVVSDLMRMDQFNTTNAPVSFTAEHPERIGGSHYSIDVHPEPSETIVFVNSSASVRHDSVPVRFTAESDVCESTVDGGKVEVAYDTDRDCIVLREN